MPRPPFCVMERDGTGQDRGRERSFSCDASVESISLTGN